MRLIILPEAFEFRAIWPREEALAVSVALLIPLTQVTGLVVHHMGSFGDYNRIVNQSHQFHLKVLIVLAVVVAAQLLFCPLRGVIAEVRHLLNFRNIHYLLPIGLVTVVPESITASLQSIISILHYIP